MSFYDGAAGEAAVNVLIDEGKLVPDFWLRVEAHEKRRGSSRDYEEVRQQVASAVQFAMGKAGVELPEWASPTAGAPDYVWIDPEWRNRFPSTEPYYYPGNMYQAMRKCYDGATLLPREEKKLKNAYLSICWRSWRRLLPHFNQEASQTLLDIEQERGNNGYSSSKSDRIDRMLSGSMLRDGALHEFYTTQGEEGLKQVFHGIGQKAVLGVGTMLFLSGEHDELISAAEKLTDILNNPLKSAK